MSEINGVVYVAESHGLIKFILNYCGKAV